MAIIDKPGRPGNIFSLPGLQDLEMYNILI